MASPPEGCKVLALRAWFGAGVNTAEFQEIFILDDVVVWQIVEDGCFIQVFIALSDGTFYICLPQLHLYVKRRVKNRYITSCLVDLTLSVNYIKINTQNTYL